MNLKTTMLAGTFLAASLSVSDAAATGLNWIDSNTNLTIYGDVRLRYEVDWDSQTATGGKRDDRHRGRVRGRLGFNYNLDDAWSFGSRLRTGDSRSQQSPHLTFATDDGLRDELDFVLDRYFVQYKSGGLTSWVGRNLTPFWQQNELFWDEDVTPTGIAGIYDTKVGEGTLIGSAGGFFLPDGGYDLNGQWLGGQLKYELPIQPSTLTFAGGMHFLNGKNGANNLRTRNGARDYLIGVGSAQWSIPIQGLPFALGADLFHNFLDYDAADVAPFPLRDRNETLGYVLSAQLGQLKKQHDWMVGYYYAHIETFAVNASYAQDDWHRFGSGAQTDASDFEGHEFRLAYAISKNLNIMTRVFAVEAITTQQDAHRFRIDLNWKF